ncbi:MAG: hypothetical protein V5A81_01725 [Candidatus Bipolaricaulota bacterium]
MENYYKAEKELKRGYLSVSFEFGLKPEIANLLSPISSRPKGI